MFAFAPKTPFGKNMYYLIKWTVIAGCIGCAGGVVGSLFSLGVLWATGFRGANPWTLWLLPLAGLFIVWFYRALHEEKNRGTNMIISSISSNEKVTFATAPLIFLSTVVTHLTGGSAGREGAALQLGGSIGFFLGEKTGLDEKDRKIAVMCGMSAVFAALFGTPIAAATFSMEVISIGVIYYAALLPSLFSAFIGYRISLAFGIEPERYPVTIVPDFLPKSVLFVVFLGALCALVSILFCQILHRGEHLYKKAFPNPFVRVLVGSTLVIALTLLVKTRAYNGSSIALIEQAMEGEVRYEAFFLKMIFTALTLGAGFKGGEIVPTLCVGATFGGAVGKLFQFQNPQFCAACGMAALFVGVTNCPISTLLIALELFGYAGMEYFSIIIAISFTLSGYYGLYASQKFVYSKTRTEFINRMPNE